MSEMVDRVARVMADALTNGNEQFDLLALYHQRQYLEAARAAIEAMMEPTDEMMMAMFEAMFEEKFDGTSAPMIGAGFEAAIQAALKEQA